MKKGFYDFLRDAQIAIPALATLYAALAAAWGWGYVEPVIATCAAVTTFIGAVLKVASNHYFGDKLIIPQEIPIDEIEDTYKVEVWEVDNENRN